MEGVVDAVVRDLWTRIGGYSLCVTEFLRITHQLLPESVFHRLCPELANGSRTPAGIPVLVQLLGGDPQCLAENAARAAALGALGVDLNFGCPAATVNRHDGGANLLQYPERILRIVEAVRQAVPACCPVSAKIRLGFDDPKLCLANAEATAAGGASQLTVHCRTKKQMYLPPADWSWIPRIQERVKIPVVANGEIWTRDDFVACLRQTQARKFMIGRGALSNPYLALEMGGQRPARWEDIAPWLGVFFDREEKLHSARYALARSKQWLKYLSLQRHRTDLSSAAAAAELFERLKTLECPKLFRHQLSACVPPEFLPRSNNLPLKEGASP
ncbi:MAG: dihydrouridine synthase [Bdellovibrio sp.]|nr:MAG: dihydrouridine synthase [Bdellovibrio sp.]